MRALALVLGAGGLVALGGLAYAASTHKGHRLMWLINGKRYAVAARLAGPGWDASMFPGFCNFSEPVITGQGTTSTGTSWTEVQFVANWCMANQQWDVPENVAISEA